MDIQNPTLNDNVRDWYMKAYPSDDYGSAIDADITFQDLVDHEGDTMQFLGRDSIIHERTISKLVEIQTELDKEVVNMAAYDRITNDYGTYGSFHTPLDLKPDEYYEPEFILDNRIFGTLDELAEEYLAGKWEYCDDYYALLHDVYESFSNFEPEELKNDLEIIRAAIKFNDDYSIEELSPEALEDKEIVMALLDDVDSRSNEYDKYNAFMKVFNAGIGALDDKDVALRYVTYRCDNLQDVSPELRDDKDVVLAAVKHDSQALKYASDRLKDDPEVVIAALRKTDCYGLLYASDRIKDNIEVVKMAMKKNEIYIKFASERIQKNPELVTAKRSFDDITKAAQEKAGSKSKEKDHSPNNRTR